MKNVAVIFFAIVSVASLLCAREDPFTPMITPKDSIRPYYGETSVFDKAQIEFPSSARLIKKIEVTFQNIDGSIQTKSIAVRGRIDWRTPLLISQVLNKNQIAKVQNTDTIPPHKPAKTMVKAVDIPSKSQSIESDIKDKQKDSSQTSAKEAPTSTQNTLDSNKSMPDSTTKAMQKSKSQAGKFSAYKVDGKSIFIAYQGNLKKHYIMQNPYRIVMNFEINKKYYKKNSYNINAPYFTRLRYGLHTHFLRIVLELDGNYVYNLEKLAGGVRINVE